MARRRGSILIIASLLVLMGIVLAGCGGNRYALDYPEEQISFPELDGRMPKVFAGVIRDLRPAAEREGRGFFSDMNYPADQEWNDSVAAIYGSALVHDLAQTHLVEVVPLRSQADYILEVDLLSFTSRIDRSTLGMLLPMVVGMGVGILVSEDTSHGIKVGAVAGVTGFIALPMPADHTAAVETRLRLMDDNGVVIWEEVCFGEVKEKINITAADRRYQDLLNKYLVRAIKKCNACLIGQLRQQFLDDLH